MNTCERVLYRDRGKVKTAILQNPTEGVGTLSGVRVNGRGHKVQTDRSESVVIMHLTCDVLSRTPMRMNSQGAELCVLDSGDEGDRP